LSLDQTISNSIIVLVSQYLFILHIHIRKGRRQGNGNCCPLSKNAVKRTWLLTIPSKIKHGRSHGSCRKIHNFYNGVYYVSRCLRPVQHVSGSCSCFFGEAIYTKNFMMSCFLVNGRGVEAV